jgi:hypothetical protein
LPKKSDSYSKEEKMIYSLFLQEIGTTLQLNFRFDLFGGVSPCILEVSIEWLTQRNLAELNAVAAFTSPAITVGGNVHIIAGKRIVTNSRIANYVAVLKCSLGRTRMWMH